MLFQNITVLESHKTNGHKIPILNSYEVTIQQKHLVCVYKRYIILLYQQKTAQNSWQQARLIQWKILNIYILHDAALSLK